MTLDVELEVLLISERLPDALPVTVGANCTLRLLDCPAESVSGRVCPVVVKPAPLTAAWETVKLPVPVLLKVTICVLAVPTSTSPKAILLGVMLSWPLPEGGGVLELTRPAQPERSKTARMAARTAKNIEEPRERGYLVPTTEHTHPFVSITIDFPRLEAASRVDWVTS